MRASRTSSCTVAGFARLTGAAIGILGLAAIVSACSGGSSGANPGTGGGGNSPGAATIDDFLQSFPPAFCGSHAACCTDAGLTLNPLACQLFVGSLFALSKGSVDSGAATYDPVAGAACLDALGASTTCSSTGPAECDAVIVGTVPMGGACAQDVECVAPATGEATCLGGVCAASMPKTTGKLGDTCEWTCVQQGSMTTCSGNGLDNEVQCFVSDGLYCDSTTQTCTARRAVGGTGCTAYSGYDCEDGAYCEVDTCVARKAVGSACASDGECVETTYCDGSTCVAKGAIGAACTSGEQCVDGGCSNGACAAPDDVGLSLLCQ